MKKLLALLFVCSFYSSYSQEKVQEPKINLKSIKISLACSGSFAIAGAITTVIRTYQIEPSAYNHVNPEKYNQTQKDLTRISSMFYAFSGISLISICFRF